MRLLRPITLLAALMAFPAWSAPAHQAAAVAQLYVGAPYRWGGAGPTGFDCSGLVQFAFGEAGIRVPRTVSTLQQATVPVSRQELDKGDLLFFYLSERRRVHVGIYLGDGLFVHAPSRGKSVAYGDFRTPFWQERFTGAGRIIAQ
jgi:cell wall-associated NlpC family hydrolase